MFTAFMMALTLTSVANVLVTMAIGPLFTALAARFVLGHRLAARTWAAIALAGLGIAWMYGHEVTAGDPRHLLARWWHWPCHWRQRPTGRCCGTCAAVQVPAATCCRRC